MSDQSPEPQPSSAKPLSDPLPEVDSRHLLQGARELRIRHGADIYRLCHTRNDKLILTK